MLKLKKLIVKIVEVEVVKIVYRIFDIPKFV